ncbi:UreD-domain-containing protein [Collybia nuda]|uniref:UreD-domain-containing protein n=1 Tax=Collybia nuda TaxID=64659 RepID=A0A9P6CDU1_9AGAR|nr:UreD-domain-containing protein [Collybia nuda]
MGSQNMPLIPNIHAGGGRIVLSSYGSSHAVFSELSSTYPLKLLSPRISPSGVAVVYILSYGGGLVGGDQVNLSVDVDTGGVLVLLSQGSTKVFKTRPEERLASVRIKRPTEHMATPASMKSPLATTQTLTFAVAAGGSLFLLPDPVTCFQAASYRQIQTFHLSRTSSLVVLDWLTSGRKSLGEEWSFSKYYSANEIWTDGKRVAKDVMVLVDDEVDPGAKLPPRSLRDKLAPYSCYAMVMLYGPLVQGAIRDMTAQYDQISVLKSKVPAEMLWSLSPMTLGEGGGAIIRVAGSETEVVKKWLEQALLGLQETIGTDVFRRAFA